MYICTYKWLRDSLKILKALRGELQIYTWNDEK